WFGSHVLLPAGWPASLRGQGCLTEVTRPLDEGTYPAASLAAGSPRRTRGHYSEDDDQGSRSTLPERGRGRCGLGSLDPDLPPAPASARDAAPVPGRSERWLGGS